MPLITELDITISSHYFSADYLASRTPGPHLKAIIDDFLAYHRLFDKRRADFADSLEEFATVGFAWERAVLASLLAGAVPRLPDDPAEASAVRAIYEHALSRALNEADRERRPREVVHVGEIEYRGVYCTPDKYNKQIRGPDEYKATWTSARNGLDAHPDWLMQVPGYVSAIGLGDSAIIRAFYVNGYYEKGQMGKPVVRAWKLRWSDEELSENIGLILDHKEVMEKENRAQW